LAHARRVRDRLPVIDFRLDPELELIRDTARQFAGEQLRPRDREHEAARAVTPSVRRAFREIGLAGVEWPACLGGADLGALARVVVLEELAAGDAGAAIALDPLGPAVYALAEAGEAAALRAHAVPLLDREDARAVLVWNGGAVAVRSGHATGVVPWVPADRADLVVLLDADSVAVVDSPIELAPLRGAGLRAAGASELRLAGAPIRDFWVDAAAARRALARARLSAAALLVGVMRASADFSREYALSRVAFGKPIAHHQALAFLITDMASAVDGARLLVHEAAARLDTGLDATEACATAFAEAAEQAVFVAPNAVQILGGHGFMQDYPVEKWMREARALSLGLGGVDAAREDAGRSALASEPLLDLVGAGA
jgi:alkylation response protein AidB-like acyl-CoA dehydrogenase